MDSFTPVLSIPVVEDYRIKGIVHNVLSKQISEKVVSREAVAACEVDDVCMLLSSSFREYDSLVQECPGKDMLLPDPDALAEKEDDIKTQRRLFLLRHGSSRHGSSRHGSSRYEPPSPTPSLTVSTSMARARPSAELVPIPEAVPVPPAQEAKKAPPADPASASGITSLLSSIKI